MLVSHILRDKGRDVLAIGPDATLAELRACYQASYRRSRCAEHDGFLAGVLSERDIVRAVAETGAAALRFRFPSV
jgi:CBS domain-containing protein